MKNVNNWCVITGSPSSGKTTLLKALEKKGYQVFYERARIYIDQELKRGRTLKEIRENELSFQQKILKLKVDLEKKLNKKELLFLDRGIPDSIAYMEMYGFKKDEYLLEASKNCYYQKVFLLKIVKYVKDYARTESRGKARLLEKLLEKSYRDLNMDVIMMPKMSVAKRVEFILNHL